MIERFVLNDLPDGWSVSWPGFEWVVCDNELKATNLLKILFDEVNVDEAIVAVKVAEYSKDEFIVNIPWYTYHQNPDASGRFLVRNHAVTGVKFVTLEKAQKFKGIMDKRLAWRQLSGRNWQ